MATVFLGLGSNIGNRELALYTAVEHLLRAGAISTPLVSPLYASPALLPEGAPAEWDIDFVNAVAKADTTLTPQALLDACKAVEARMDRTDRGHWGPREIDVDILAYGTEVIETPELIIPHAQLAFRDFVLLPWRDIAADWQHPLSGKTIAGMCESLTNPKARLQPAPVLKAI